MTASASEPLPLVYVTMTEAVALQILYEFGSPMSSKLMDEERKSGSSTNILRNLANRGWVVISKQSRPRGKGKLPNKPPYVYSLTEKGIQALELMAAMHKERYKK